MSHNICIRIFTENGPQNIIKDISGAKFNMISDLLIEHKSNLFQFLQASTINFSSISKEFPLYHIGEIKRHPDNLEPCVVHNAILIKVRPNDFIFNPQTGDCTQGAERLISVSSFFSPLEIRHYIMRQKS